MVCLYYKNTNLKFLINPKISILILIVFLSFKLNSTLRIDNKSRIIQKEIIQIQSNEILSDNENIKNQDYKNIFEFEHIKINFKINKYSNIIDLEDFNIPSDLIEFFPENENFELILNQGRIPFKIKDKIYIENNITESVFKDSLKNNDYIIPGIYFIDDYLLTDLPAGYMIFMGANEFTNYGSKKNIKLFFDIFSYVFKITLNPIMDRTNYVNFLDYYLMTDNSEKACSDHLDGIKNILPFKIKKLFEEYVNYNSFVESDFKSIKISMENVKSKDDHINSINFSIKIIYRNTYFSSNKLEESIDSTNKNSIVEFKQTKRNLIKLMTWEGSKSLEILSKNNESYINMKKYFNSKDENEKNFLINLFNPKNIFSYNNISTKRYVLGEIHGFENLKINHKIKINSNNKNIFKVIDLIPGNIDILFSTIKIEMKINLFFDKNKNNNKDNKFLEELYKIKINLNLNSNEQSFGNFFKFSLSEKLEEQNPRIPFTYENKKSTQLNLEQSDKFFENLFAVLQINKGIRESEFDFLNSINFIQLLESEKEQFLYEIDFYLSYELRKKILNFESMENENENGYKIPSGLVLISNKKNYKPILLRLSNHYYFNYPDVDNTMPFNIIALSWVVYGFLFIQTLNLFLIKRGDEEKSLLQSIKDRFMAKWGFLFGR